MSVLSLISVIIIVSGALYVRQILLFTRGLGRLEHGSNSKTYSVVVLVAARNEERNIERCVAALNDQDYPADKFSVVVIDDHSTDRTAALVEGFSDEHSNVKLLRVQERQFNVSPKINALDHAIAETSSDLIFTTDADCIAGPKWISSLVKHFESQVGVVSGITLFSKSTEVSRALAGFQNLDFFSQTACGAGAIGLNAVNNCNGSNMGFRRSAFNEIGGYAAISHVNSGSDSLLAQRIVAMTEWKMRFAFEPESHVFTAPLASWRQVLEQRMRWAGQTPNYPPSTLVFLTASFLLYLTLFVCVPLSLIYWPSFPTPMIVLLIKATVDFRIITKFMKLSGADGMMKFFLTSELIHIPVVLIAVCGSILGSFEWKGRKMRRQISQHT